MVTRAERIEGGLMGLLIGDALGVPYEFHPPSRIPLAAQIDFSPPEGFARAHASVPPGTWSDDGAHALCLLASLLYQKGIDLDDLGRRLINWRDLGYLCVDAEVFDVGIQTERAISSLRNGVPAAAAGPSGETDNGNGSLMRVLPLALWHRGSDEQLIADARAQSLPTHGHLRSQVCCALYCVWARRALEEHPRPWEAAVESVRAKWDSSSPERQELEQVIRPDDPTPGTGTGYVVDCLRSARAVQSAGTYEEVVRAAIALGNDTDTTAAVAGGIAGIRAGIQGIPERWRRALRGQELLTPLLNDLLGPPLPNQ